MRLSYEFYDLRPGISTVSRFFMYMSKIGLNVFSGDARTNTVHIFHRA